MPANPSGTLQTFSQLVGDAPQRVQLPVPERQAPLLGQVPSWRIIFSREIVPVFVTGLPPGQFNPSATGADQEGFYPIVAAYLEAVSCRPGVGGEDSSVFLDDGLARCSFTLNEATFAPEIPGTVSPYQVTPDPSIVTTNQTLDWSLKISNGSIGSSVFHGTTQIVVDPGNPANRRSLTKGLLGAISGVLCTQFEFWARVNAPMGGGTAVPVSVRMQFTMDRIGGQVIGYPGPISTQLAGFPTDLPAV